MTRCQVFQPFQTSHKGVFPIAMDSASLVEFASALHKHDSIPGDL